VVSVTLRRALWVGLGCILWLTAACDLNPQPVLPVEGGTTGGSSTGNQGGTGVNLGGNVDVPSAGTSTGGKSSVGGGAPSSGGSATNGGQGSGGEASGGEASGGEGPGGTPDTGGAGGEAGQGGEPAGGAGGSG
jgi:hypothetical protein